MNRYTVYISPQADQELDAIYEYIKDEFKAPGTAENMVDLFEDAILSLEEMPQRERSDRMPTADTDRFL